MVETIEIDLSGTGAGAENTEKASAEGKKIDIFAFTTNIRTGETLRSFAASVRGYRKRECFQQLHDFVYSEPQDKVFILYGLRWTGKTTMLRQLLRR